MSGIEISYSGGSFSRAKYMSCELKESSAVWVDIFYIKTVN